ncbi:PAS domain-containing protein [Methylobacterium sp. J-078]|uniref:PAS domain-containing protein n=1 Tax=Methylobacterium sp. J-078 TaxID=2836657 RepID=UPI001FB8B595|nr:PAS domain-containing protein [Methylobacterium sp. J-078]MCJ2044015.1 PAS domain-containing protein [Methylobacterium sp. J-078]
MTHRDPPAAGPLKLGIDAGAFVAAFTASPTPMVLTDPRLADNPIIWANDAFLALTGYAWEDLDGRNCRMLQGADTDPRAVRRLGEAVRAGRPIEIELVNYRKDGTSFWNGMTVAPVRDATGRIVHFYSAQADMTGKYRHEVAMRDANDELERRVAEQTADLRAALEQKTALLHEVDHRVKNNLQVISSLMLLKARRTPRGEVRDALQGMAERVGALSTVHRMLYSTGDVTRFDLREFAEDFVSELVAGIDNERTAVSAEIDSIAVSAAMAAPLALMLHELATNAVRHAFPDSRAGRITITAQRSDEGLRMLIQDDGIGLAGGKPNPAGFGRSLVEMVVRQLRGVIVWSDVAPGTRVEITVPLDAVSLRTGAERAAEAEWTTR